MALAVDGKFFFRKMAAARFDHAFFKGRGPRGHAIPEMGLRFCPRNRARAVAIALRRIFHDLVLIRRDQFALLPDRRAHRAVGVDRVVGPIAAWVGKIESAGESAGDHAKNELAPKQFLVSFDAFEITRATLPQKKARLLTDSAEWNFAGFHRFFDN